MSTQTPTQTPTNTPTPTITSNCSVTFTVSNSTFCGTGSSYWWRLLETSANEVYNFGTYDDSTNTLVGLPASFTPQPIGYSGYMETQLIECSTGTICAIDNWLVYNGSPTRVYPSNILNSPCGSFTIAPYSTP
jgi:hypothetical protein